MPSPASRTFADFDDIATLIDQKIRRHQVVGIEYCKIHDAQTLDQRRRVPWRVPPTPCSAGSDHETVVAEQTGAAAGPPTQMGYLQIPARPGLYKLV
jgi:hypothetical protein